MFELLLLAAIVVLAAMVMKLRVRVKRLELPGTLVPDSGFAVAEVKVRQMIGDALAEYGRNR